MVIQKKSTSLRPSGSKKSSKNMKLEQSFRRPRRVRTLHQQISSNLIKDLIEQFMRTNQWIANDEDVIGFLLEANQEGFKAHIELKREGKGVTKINI